MKLYSNEISSASSRVRIALAIKGIAPEILSVSILGPDAENRQRDYLALNPQGLVPALLTENGTLITQSLSIVEYLDERFPQPPLLPADLEARAFTRTVALAIAAEIHALVPPRVAAQLGSLGLDANAIGDWNRHWIREGLGAVESLLNGRRSGRSGRSGRSCQYVAGDTPTVGDLFLFPQAINAERAGLPLALWPNLAEVVNNLRAVPAFAENAPAPRR
ncbi:maleylacetoacetate isomerase [Cupriavidus plantarum]|uniref:maleylacetoacetate isomerase n=1 Tax=Cupriavidus plantarum TaxID=942865 RepID=UPI0015CE09D8|nr:maleylacetoacetate isomerase [Cupriavidus plantarum]NYI02411.1 maleylpyruvate isomerase [Cupriavidus plantarum]